MLLPNSTSVPGLLPATSNVSAGRRSELARPLEEAGVLNERERYASLVAAGPLSLGREEVAIIAAASDGLVHKQIARAFGMSKRSVEYRLWKAATALAAENTVHLVALAIRAELVLPRPWAPLRALTQPQLVVVKALSEGSDVAGVAEREGVVDGAITARIRVAKTRTGCATRCELAALFASYEVCARQARGAARPHGRTAGFPRVANSGAEQMH